MLYLKQSQAEIGGDIKTQVHFQSSRLFFIFCTGHVYSCCLELTLFCGYSCLINEPFMNYE